MTRDLAKGERTLYLIVPAAGRSTRMAQGTNKQFLPVAGIPVLARTLIAFRDFLPSLPGTALRAIILSSEESRDEVEDLCREILDKTTFKVVIGGACRQESVAKGVLSLEELTPKPKSDDTVLIHDGARCLVDADTIRRAIEGAEEFGVCAAAVPVKDTVKRVNNGKERRVVETPDRSALYLIQTPQAFRYDLLQKTYANAGDLLSGATDDASLAEAAGIPVHLVDGSYSNIKITTTEDLYLADCLENCRTHDAR